MTFAEQFAQSQGQPIRVEGHTMHALYRRQCSRGLEAQIRWLRSIDVPVQGVSLSVNAGMLQVGHSRAKDVMLWTDTAPDEVTLRYDGKNVGELSLWNCWRDDCGVPHAWVGNSGMIIEEHDPGLLRFRCNSRPEVTSEDLVFEVAFN